jgi:hypothetical protein
MLGLIFIYYLGKKFYELAIEYKRSPWPYAILGIVGYYAGLLGFALVLGLFLGMTNNSDFLGGNEFLLGLICIPFGLLSARILYIILEKKWGKNSKAEDENELLDSF